MLLPIEEFLAQREQLFHQGPVERIPFQQTLLHLCSARHPSLHDTLSQASTLLIQPRCGVSDHQEMLALLRFLEHAGGADILTLTIDSYTRLNQYEQAASGKHLNGYPLVTHGVACGQELVASVRRPVQVRHGSPDGRLLVEVSYASGASGFEGGGISYNLPYCKDVPLRRSLAHWRYVDRLTGLLSEWYILDRETFGPLSSVLMPPSISIAISILEMALAVEQGVQCVTIGYPQSGCVVQDIAALQSIPTLCRRHVETRGLPMPALFTSFHQWMGVFPEEEAKAMALLALGATTAVIGNATKLINKTFQEAKGVPTKEANAACIRFCKEVARYSAQLAAFASPAERLEEERYWLEREVEEILAAVYVLDRGDLAEAIASAFDKGLLDIPFPASRHARGAVIPARSQDGAIRYLQVGQLPFSDATLAFHREKLGADAAPDYQRVLDGVYAIAFSDSPRLALQA